MVNSFKKNLLLDRRFSCKDAISGRGPVWEGSIHSPLRGCCEAFGSCSNTNPWLHKRNGVPNVSRPLQKKACLEIFLISEVDHKKELKSHLWNCPSPVSGSKRSVHLSGSVFQLQLGAEAQSHSEKKQASCPLHCIHPSVSNPTLGNGALQSFWLTTGGFYHKANSFYPVFFI